MASETPAKRTQTIQELTEQVGATIADHVPGKHFVLVMIDAANPQLAGYSSTLKDDDAIAVLETMLSIAAERRASRQPAGG